MTRFIPLFSKSGTFILQLDNLINSKLDGEYASVSFAFFVYSPRGCSQSCAAARLEATFFASSPEYPPAPRADLIVPLTTFANNTGNDASVPPQFSVSPRFLRYSRGKGKGLIGFSSTSRSLEMRWRLTLSCKHPALVRRRSFGYLPCLSEARPTLIVCLDGASI